MDPDSVDKVEVTNLTQVRRLCRTFLLHRRHRASPRRPSAASQTVAVSSAAHRETAAAAAPRASSQPTPDRVLAARKQFVMQHSGDAELAMMMSAMAMACKGITRAVRKAGIAGLNGLAGEVNSTGDDVKKLDILSNDIMVSALLNSHCCAVLVSEENEEPIIVEPAKAGRLCVAFDPLDGSSNIDCNVSTGTIFGVWEKKGDGAASVDDILRPGSEQICAGYCMYGSATELVLTGKSDEVFGAPSQARALNLVLLTYCATD